MHGPAIDDAYKIW